MTSTDVHPGKKPPIIILCAMEPSGDAIGAALMDALRIIHPDVQLHGCGGPLMEAKGLKSIFPIAPFSVMGPVDALKALPAALSGARALVDLVAEHNADGIVLIDSWAFSKMVAKRIKSRGLNTTLIKYAAPQVWASRPQRAKQLAALFDGVLTLFAFENEWFEKEGVKVKFVGNPTFQEVVRGNFDGAAFRARHNIGDGKLLAVLPGSRKGEVRRLGSVFQETVRQLMLLRPDLRIVVPVAPAVENDVRAMLANWPGQSIMVHGDDRFEAFAAADAALAASGTVTTELAISKTPMIIAYRVGPLSAMWMRRVVTTPFASLINIASKRAVIPEFLQEACLPVEMAATLAPLLEGGAARMAQLEAFPTALEKLGIVSVNVADSAAATILLWIGEK